MKMESLGVAMTDTAKRKQSQIGHGMQQWGRNQATKQASNLSSNMLARLSSAEAILDVSHA